MGLAAGLSEWKQRRNNFVRNSIQMLVALCFIHLIAIVGYYLLKPSGYWRSQYMFAVYGYLLPSSVAGLGAGCCVRVLTVLAALVKRLCKK